MRRLTLFQVGDVHFPDHAEADADVKDGAFPASLISATSSKQLMASTRELVAQLADAPGAGLIFSGDLTSKGDLAAYGECVDYLVNAFLLDNPEHWDPSRIHVVPGNHDVNRDLAAEQMSGDLFSKFAPLRAAWARHGLDVIAIETPRRSYLSEEGARIDLFGLNSCLGCGEKRSVSNEIQAHVRNGLLQLELDDEGIDSFMVSLLESTTETIDAPAIAEFDIGLVCEAIRTESAIGLPVLIGHHNVLQQAQPRFDLYTDLVNAGMFRSRLAGLAIPILYLHGHIHSDAIEVVHQATPDSGQLVLISCPEFKDGFNRIEICFTEAGVPVGCVIHKFRRRLHGGIAQEGAPVRIPLMRAEPTMSGTARTIAQVLFAKPDIGLVADIHRDLESTLTVEQVAEAVQELEWLGIVDVLSAELPPKSWRLRVVAGDD
jgi:hypothetical protein